jgi:hydrogenase maturation factor
MSKRLGSGCFQIARQNLKLNVKLTPHPSFLVSSYFTQCYMNLISAFELICITMTFNCTEMIILSIVLLALWPLHQKLDTANQYMTIRNVTQNYNTQMEFHSIFNDKYVTVRKLGICGL